jgi:hypothetical protein
MKSAICYAIMVAACFSCLVQEGLAQSSAPQAHVASQPRASQQRVARMPMPEWPYGASDLGDMCSDTTLGQLTKTAERIVVGKVDQVANVSTNAIQPGEDKAFLTDLARAGTLKALDISFERELVVGQSAGQMNVWLPVFGSASLLPRSEDRVIVFLSDKLFVAGQSNAREWAFDRNKAASGAKKHQRMEVDGKDRGILKLEDKAGAELVRVVEGYVKHLRSPNRDRRAYFDFLQALTTNNIERVRLDAKTDALHLIPSLSREELEGVVTTETTDGSLRDYARQVMEWRKGHQSTQ